MATSKEEMQKRLYGANTTRPPVTHKKTPQVPQQPVRKQVPAKGQHAK